MPIRIATFSAVATLLTALTGCAADLPSPDAPHSIIGYAVNGEKPVAPQPTPRRSDAERPAPPSQPMRETMSPRRDGLEPMRKYGDR